jgi:hypothetical protein
MFLLFLLIFAFVIGMQNLHSYYSEEKREVAELKFAPFDNDYGRSVELNIAILLTFVQCCVV